jgi:hypothetical protein
VGAALDVCGGGACLGALTARRSCSRLTRAPHRPALLLLLLLPPTRRDAWAGAPAPKAALPVPKPAPRPTPPPGGGGAARGPRFVLPEPGSLLASAPAIARTGLPQRNARRNRRPVMLAPGEDWGAGSESDEDWGGGGGGGDGDGSPAASSSEGGSDFGDEISDEELPAPAADAPLGPRRGARSAGAAAAPPPPAAAAAAPPAPPPPAAAPPPVRAAPAPLPPPGPPPGDDDSDDDDYNLSDEESDDSDMDEGPARKKRPRGRGRGRGAAAPAAPPPPPKRARRDAGPAPAPAPWVVAARGGGGAMGAPRARKPSPAAAAAAAPAPVAAAAPPADGPSLHPVAGSFVASPRGGDAGAAAAAAARAAALAVAPEAEEDGVGRGAAHDRWLAQAGMVLRDPPAQHLLAAAAVGRLHRCVDERALPRADRALALMLQLLALGVDARRQLRDRRYAMPPPPERALGSVWPQVVDVLAEAALDPAPGDEERERPHGSAEGWQVCTRGGVHGPGACRAGALRPCCGAMPLSRGACEVAHPPPPPHLLAHPQELVAGYKADEVVRKVVQVRRGTRPVVGTGDSRREPVQAASEAARPCRTPLPANRMPSNRPLPPQMLVLDRLCSHDLVSARLLLCLMRESGHWGFRSAVPEYAPFAYSLAGARP